MPDSPKIPWHSLERLIPYRDLVMLLGFGLITAAVAVIYWPGALLVGGGFLVLLSWMMAR